MNEDQAVAEFRELMADPAARQAFVEVRRAKEEGPSGRRYQHILRAVFGTPWVIYEPWMQLIANLVLDRALNIRMDAIEIEERIDAARRSPRPQGPAGVAVIPIHGPIVPKASMFSEVSGATSVEGLRANFREAMDDRRVSAVVFDVDSPGGSVQGIPELADEIRAARGRKPMTTVADGLLASGAYFLGSQADEIVASKTSLVGSIGVITAHEDLSVAAEQKGIKTTFIRAGKYKAEGNALEPFSDEARAHVQSMVDEFYGMFVAAVARGRHTTVDAVRNGYGEGRVLTASMGLREGMIDRIGSLEQIVGEHLRGSAPRAQGQAATVGLSVSVDGSSAAHAFDDYAKEIRERTAAGIEAMEGLGEVEATIELVDLPLDLYAAVDNSAWDGSRAMGQCSSAADYRSICAGERTTGSPDERQHWALPHHYLGKGPNANGVRAALGRIGQTQNLKNREAAQAHLDAHQSEIDRARADASDDPIRKAQARLALMKSR